MDTLKNTVSIKNLDKAVVLAALYNAAKPIYEYMRVKPETMSPEEARLFLKNKTVVFGEFIGRILKIKLDTDVIHTEGYDAANGAGKARQAIEQAREQILNFAT